ncbi:MAG: hypothetical protein J7L86_01675 [Candidatus Marinimicrobia bacterium]|nr:hypothetical protein [Candidatus Neomarinimicrobiota bacterium]
MDQSALKLLKSFEIGVKSKQFAKKVFRKVVGSAKTIMEGGKYQKIAENYDLRGYKRIYLVHIRRTNYQAQISENYLTKLREILDEEYRLLSSIKHSLRV